MKIKRSVLEKIVREELANHIKSLMEAPKSKKPGMEDAEAGNEKNDKKAGDKVDPAVKPKKQAPIGAGKSPVKKDGSPAADELPVAAEPEADADLEKDVADPASEEDPEDVTGGKIADQITGKSVQSVTMEPKSKLLPGAQEVVITFKEIPEPLKILITKSGQVKFHFKGLHNKI